jgi:prepilin-type N-terminal cleavage/methylation domain-containing protein
MARSGQSLIEVLVAVAIGAVLFVGTAVLVAPSLSINKATGQIVIATALGKEMLDNVRVWSAGDWHNVLNLATSSAHTYFLVTSSSPFVASSGSESILVSTTTYTRFFYLNDVYRDSNGNVTSTLAGNAYDPSTKQVVITYGWPRGVTTTVTAYLTRYQAKVFDQTDWSGGSGQSGPVTSTNAQFASDSNMTGTSTVGSLFASALPAYSFKRSITVTSTNTVASGTLTNFPMLVSSTLSSWKSVANGGEVNNLCLTSNGGQEPCDLVFATSTVNCATSSLNFETESYSSSTGALIDWVSVPSLSAGTVIYVCYGNTGVTTDQSHPSSTWDGNYKGVYHFPNGSSLSVANSASSTFGSTNHGVTATAGQIDGGSSYDASTKYIDLANPSVHYDTGVTLEAWINQAAASSSSETIIEKGYDNGNGKTEVGLRVGDTINQGIPQFFTYSAGTHGVVASAQRLSAATWYHLAGTFDGTNWRMYINGALTDNVVDSSYFDNTSNWAIGADEANGIGNIEFWNGTIDEARISNIARSPSWILTEYNNQANPSTFYTVGGEVTVNSGATIGQLDSETLDTGVALGAQFNSILWQGFQQSGSTVQFQLAVSNASSGPWNYVGSDGTSNTYYTPSAPGSGVSLSNSIFNNFRYLRYRIFISYVNGTSSRVDDVVVNWSP